MKSDTWNVRQIFQDRRQFCVPFYQRAYVWDQKQQWGPLWMDIQDKANARLGGNSVTPHFLGAVVVEPQERHGIRGVDTLHIIDGQQRLTTLQYIITALVVAMRELGINGLDSALLECLRNGNPDTMRDAAIEQFKVWPTFQDRNHNLRSMDCRKLDELKAQFPDSFTQAGSLRVYGGHPPSLAAIWYFADEFIAWIKASDQDPATSAEALHEAIMRDLKLVLILLQEEDDAQVIFETMNGRGATLHSTDLIRNFVFMRADRDGSDAQTLYDDKWKQFESSKWSERERRGRILKPRLEWMIHATLQAETSKEVDLSRLYADYKSYVLGSGNPKTAEKQLATLDLYAQHYMALTQGAGSLPIARFGRRILPYETTTTHSLALLISTSGLSDAEKSQMFDTILSYVVRRAICGLTPKNYNNIFMAAIRHLAREGITPTKLRDHFDAYQGDYARWPGDAEFKNACQTAPLYYGRLDASRMRSLLTELEGLMRAGARSEEPQLPNLSNLDIDHLMPRSWYQYWALPGGATVTPQEASHALLAEREGRELTDQQKLIRQRETSIHTLGNLSLLNLSVNREAQNKEFKTKRDLLIANTNLSLNVQLLTRQDWDVADIAARGERLAELATKLYPR